ncbi:MAG: hypothetical protein CMP86_03620, partial [Gammaproteobacteria bacterium]|nr:hypothetical protein [Gammaproteobacteria bacterium]
EPSAQLGRPSGTKSLQRDLDDRREQRAFSATGAIVGKQEPSAQLGRPSAIKSLQRNLDDRRQQRAFSVIWTASGESLQRKRLVTRQLKV